MADFNIQGLNTKDPQAKAGTNIKLARTQAKQGKSDRKGGKK